jgi:hypothetical protein
VLRRRLRPAAAGAAGSMGGGAQTHPSNCSGNAARCTRGGSCLAKKGKAPRGAFPITIVRRSARADPIPNAHGANPDSRRKHIRGDKRAPRRRGTLPRSPAWVRRLPACGQSQFPSRQEPDASPRPEAVLVDIHTLRVVRTSLAEGQQRTPAKQQQQPPRSQIPTLLYAWRLFLFLCRPDFNQTPELLD